MEYLEIVLEGVDNGAIVHGTRAFRKALPILDEMGDVCIVSGVEMPHFLCVKLAARLSQYRTVGTPIFPPPDDSDPVPATGPPLPAGENGGTAPSPVAAALLSNPPEL